MRARVSSLRYLANGRDESGSAIWNGLERRPPSPLAPPRRRDAKKAGRRGDGRRCRPAEGLATKEGEGNALLELGKRPVGTLVNNLLGAGKVDGLHAALRGRKRGNGNWTPGGRGGRGRQMRTGAPRSGGRRRVMEDIRGVSHKLLGEEKHPTPGIGPERRASQLARAPAKGEKEETYRERGRRGGSRPESRDGGRAGGVEDGREGPGGRGLSKRLASDGARGGHFGYCRGRLMGEGERRGGRTRGGLKRPGPGLKRVKATAAGARPQTVRRARRQARLARTCTAPARAFGRPRPKSRPLSPRPKPPTNRRVKSTSLGTQALSRPDSRL